MQKFVYFNIIMFGISYIIDFIASALFGVEASFTNSYIQYVLFVNLPISSILTIFIMNKFSDALGI